MVQPITTLAADIGDLLEFALPVIVFLIVSIFSMVKAAKENKSRPTPRGQGGDPSAAERARQIAEERRRKLQELARQRPGQSPGGATVASPLSPGGEQADARQREQALRRRAAEEAAQREALEQRQAEAERRRVAARRRAADSAAQLERQQRIANQFEQAQQRRMRVDASQPGHRSGQVHRHVSEAPKAKARHRTSHADWVRKLAGADPRSLQRAIILSEVLGKPVGQRQPGESPNTIF